MRLLLIRRVGNKKFTHIFEGNNITTQPRLSISPDRHLDFRLPPARPPARPSPLGLPQLEEWTPSAPCARAPLAAVGSSIAFGWCPTPARKTVFFRPPKSKSVTFWAVSRTYPIQLNCTDSRDRGHGGISSGDFPSKARSAFVHNAIVRSLSHGEVTCHRPWTFSFVSHDLKSSQETPIMTTELPDKMYRTILRAVKCSMIRPQRYTVV